MSSKPWCVSWRTRDSRNSIVGEPEWCAAADQSAAPPEGISNVPTRCGYFITLPIGIERRQPTCPECLAK